jgi:imidazolonepropionase-like amidohydrolase
MTRLITLAFLLLWSPMIRAQETIAIKAGTIITAVSDPIKNGVVLIRNGRILDVGADVKIPTDARVLRYPGGVVFPGLIECHSTAGLRYDNENVPVVPYLTVLDGVNPKAKNFGNYLRDGVTTVHVVPGNKTQIGGQGAVLRPVGPIVDAMVVKSPSVLKIAVSPSRGGNRMDHMASLRRTFKSLYDHLESLPPHEEEIRELPQATPGDQSLADLLRPGLDWSKIDYSKIPDDKIDAQKRPLVDLVRGKLPAMIYCDRASDVLHAFEIIDNHGIRATLVLGRDAYRARDLLAARKNLGLVVLDPSLEDYDRDPDTGKNRRHLTARILFDAGVRFAVASRGSGARLSGVLSRDGSFHLWYQAAALVRQGIPVHEAVRAVTINPAHVLGLQHRLGSIEKGKDANIAIFTGDAFDVRSWVDRVFIEGNEVYHRAKDRNLQELLRRREQDF